MHNFLFFSSCFSSKLLHLTMSSNTPDPIPLAQLHLHCFQVITGYSSLLWQVFPKTEPCLCSPSLVTFSCKHFSGWIIFHVYPVVVLLLFRKWPVIERNYVALKVARLFFQLLSANYSLLPYSFPLRFQQLRISPRKKSTYCKKTYSRNTQGLN